MCYTGVGVESATPPPCQNTHPQEAAFPKRKPEGVWPGTGFLSLEVRRGGEACQPFHYRAQRACHGVTPLLKFEAWNCLSPRSSIPLSLCLCVPVSLCLCVANWLTLPTVPNSFTLKGGDEFKSVAPPLNVNVRHQLRKIPGCGGWVVARRWAAFLDLRLDV